MVVPNKRKYSAAKHQPNNNRKWVPVQTKLRFYATLTHTCPNKTSVKHSKNQRKIAPEFIGIEKNAKNIDFCQKVRYYTHVYAKEGFFGANRKGTIK